MFVFFVKSNVDIVVIYMSNIDIVIYVFNSFVGESMKDEASVVFAYYKDGATNPTFLYFSHGLKEIKC